MDNIEKSPGYGTQEPSEPEVFTKDVKQVDRAALFLAEADVEGANFSAAREKKLLRKIDWLLLPMVRYQPYPLAFSDLLQLFLTATLGAVDKVAISTAAIYGLRDDIGLHGQQYSWLGSILSLGALVGMFPSSALMHKFPSAKYLCFCSCGWSAMALIFPSCTSWAGMMVVRFLMGAFEAIIVPGISVLIAGWYKKEEQPPRNALVFAAASSVINGFLSWLIGYIPDDAPLAKWQYLYLLVGSISMAWSIFVLIVLPDSPMNASFLTEEEKVFWVRRLSENKTGIVNKTWKWDQVREALMDPKTWIIFFFNISINIPNGGLTTFNGIIIKNLGFTAKQASLLSMPTGVMSTLASFTFSMIAAKWNNRRCLVTVFACCVPIIGTAILYGVHRTAIPAQMVGLYLVYTYFGPYVVGISLAQANTAGNTKKSVSFAVLYIGYAVGNLIGPQTFRASQAPAYTGGVIAMLCCYCACIVLICVYWLVCLRMNQRVIDAQEPVEAVEENFQDTSDWKQHDFKYTT
jgi:ACS family allantoate permease-like MFS transporter